MMRQIGSIPADDYRRTFNLGVGMILAVSANKASTAITVLKKMKQPNFIIGTVAKTPRGAKQRVIYS